VAGVSGAGVLVVAVGGGRAGLAAGDRGVLADAGVAGVRGAGVPVVAVGGGRAGRPAGDRRVLAGAGVAGLRGAGVPVVAVGGGRTEPAPGDGRVGADAGAAGVRRTSVPVVAVGRSRTVWLDVDAALARVPAGAVLIAVVHHELQAVGVPRDHLPGGHQVVHVPAYLGAPALVAQARRSGIAAAEVPVVPRR